MAATKMATTKLWRLALNKINFKNKTCNSVIRCMSTDNSVTLRGSLDATHTGQKWDDNDYRNARFVNASREVNKQFAINLIAEVEPIASKQRVVSCDGGGGPTGHPKVYINLDKPGNHICGYCGLRFYLDHHH